MKMCIQAVLDGAGALRHMNKNNSERPVCTTHPLAPISTSFLFVFDTEWVMSTCEHQGRDTVLHTCLKLHWSRHSASSCFNRVWNVTISSAKHQSMLRPWVMQHEPWPSPSAWTKTRSLHGCRNFYLLILPSPLSLPLSLSLFFSLFLTGPTFWPGRGNVIIEVDLAEDLKTKHDVVVNVQPYHSVRIPVLIGRGTETHEASNMRPRTRSQYPRSPCAHLCWPIPCLQTS